MCKRGIILLITILHAAGFHAMGQDHSVVYKYYSLPVNYSYSGITNSVFMEQGLSREDNSGSFGSYVLEAGGGIAWNTHVGTKPLPP
jgi:hypothetical protein